MSWKERTRRLSESLRMRWKRMLSYRKKDWEFTDYPVRVRTQDVNPAWNSEHFKQHPYIASIPGIFLDAGGETRRDALGALAAAFARRKAYVAEQGETMPRPGTYTIPEFAETEHVDLHGDIVNDLLEQVLGLKWAWVSDLTRLQELTLQADIGDVFSRIHERYGVDVSDVPDGNLAAVAHRIAVRRDGYADCGR